MLYFLRSDSENCKLNLGGFMTKWGSASYGWIEWLAGREIVNKVIQEGEGNDSERCR